MSEHPTADIPPHLLRNSLKNAPEGLYLILIHGRHTPDEELDDWGFDGGYVGPLTWFHTTYLYHIRVGVGDQFDELEIPVVMDMISVNGKFYGDWEVTYHRGE